eukprot:6722713-Ditylum_brightwellii.AAC.1
MIAFGIKSTLVRFQEKYHNYKGVIEEIPENDEDKNGLAIGSYKAVDDNLVVFRRQLGRTVIARWLASFQLTVNKLVDGAFFEFTTELWNPPNHPVSPNIVEEESNTRSLLQTWRKK